MEINNIYRFYFKYVITKLFLFCVKRYNTETDGFGFFKKKKKIIYVNNNRIQ